MDDEELRRRLKECGVNAGPIVDSTRDLYKRLLHRRQIGLCASVLGSTKPSPSVEASPAPTPQTPSSPQVLEDIAVKQNIYMFMY